MEALRVLELYSGIGGMHQALRGERAHSASPFLVALVRALFPGGEERPDARGGDGRGRGELGCPGNRPSRPPPPAALRSLPSSAALENSVCGSWSSRLGGERKWCPRVGAGSPRPSVSARVPVGQPP